MGIQTQTRMGEAIVVPGARIYPVSQTYEIKQTGIGGISWSKPQSVFITLDSGEEVILPIRDVTRDIQIKLLIFGFFGSLLIWLLRR